MPKKEERYQTADMTALRALEKYLAGEVSAAENLLCPTICGQQKRSRSWRTEVWKKERAAKMARFMSR